MTLSLGDCSFSSCYHSRTHIACRCYQGIRIFVQTHPIALCSLRCCASTRSTHWILIGSIICYSYSDGQKSCTFFLEFFRGPPPWGSRTNFGTGQFCEMESSNSLIKDISSEKIRQLENAISQNQWIPKLAPLPQGPHKKSRKNVQGVWWTGYAADGYLAIAWLWWP